jgi:YVTN family beta-propeller protein
VRWVATAALLAALLAPAPLAPPLMAQARLYATNQDDATISVIDAGSRRLIETVDLRKYGFGDNAKPHHAQVEPDGRYWYVTLIGANKVVKFDRRDRLVGSADMEVPGLMTLDPRRDLMYVGRSMSAVNPPPRMAIIRRSDMKVLDEVDLLFPRPHGIVAPPGGGRVYVSSLGTNQIASVGADDEDVTLTDVPGSAAGFVQAAVSPDGRWLAVTAQLTDSLLVFSLADPRKPRLVRGIALPDGPFEPAFTLDGRWVYVTCLTANQVAVVDARTWKVAATLSNAGFGQPHGIAQSPDGRWVFVSNRHQLGGVHQHEGGQPTGQGTVVAICAPTHAVDTVLTVGQYAAGMGMPAPRKRVDRLPAACR